MDHDRCFRDWLSEFQTTRHAASMATASIYVLMRKRRFKTRRKKKKQIQLPSELWWVWAHVFALCAVLLLIRCPWQPLAAISVCVCEVSGNATQSHRLTAARRREAGSYSHGIAAVIAAGAVSVNRKAFLTCEGKEKYERVSRLFQGARY